MAGVEPRDVYLCCDGRYTLRAEILVMFKKGGRPQCSNGKYFRVRLYDKFI